MTLKQWQNSTVTLNPPEELAEDLPATTTFSHWDKKAKAYEYSYFLNKLKDEERANFPIYNVSDLFKHFTFEDWYSASVVLKYLSDPNFSP